MKTKLPRKIKKARTEWLTRVDYPRTKWVKRYFDWRDREWCRFKNWLNSRHGGVVSPGSVSGREPRTAEVVLHKSQIQQYAQMLSKKDGMYANMVFVSEADYNAAVMKIIHPRQKPKPTM